MIGLGSRQFALGERRARQDTADEPSAGLAASGVERLGVGFVQQLDRHKVALVVGPRVAQRQREARPVAVGVLREIDPVLDLRGRQGQAGQLVVLPRGVVAIAADLRKRARAAAGPWPRQVLVHQVNVEEDQARGDAVDVQMVDTGVEGEMVGVLHDAEGEAIPLERLRRRRQCVCANLFGVHVSEIHRHEIDVLGVVDHAAEKDAVLEFEPIVVGVVPTDMRIDRCGHCRNVADTGNVPRHDHQAG